MNFFEAQERARKASRNLVWWFMLSVLGVILVMYVLAMVVLGGGADVNNLAADGFAVQGFWDGKMFAGTSGIVGGVIMLGSWFKLAQLSGGGKVVAKSLNGRQVEPTTTDLPERRLLNVVEEMAIASGLPVPEVWIMDQETGINAFAAGTDPSNAVIGVTRGTLDRLTRDELQGVVAHEFSHILNGDMKMNMRLMGWIFGLVMLAMLGRMMLEAFRFMRGSRDSKAGAAVLAIVVAGVGVWAVGSVGVLFARMLQAAISRQREYLADASAVQFTRNPEGIAGALKKIGGFQEHGKIASPQAMEARHMFFAGSGFSSMMATHPPLEKRILAIEPRWQGGMLKGKADPVTREELAGFSGFSGGAAERGAGVELAVMGDSRGMDSRVGARIREELRAGNVTSFSREEAKLLLLGLLVAVDGDAREEAERILYTEGLEPEQIGQILRWSEDLGSYTAAQKLALVDLSLSWLRKMSAEEAREFAGASKSLIEADGEVNLFEFMLQKVIERHVEIGLGLRAVPGMKHRTLASLGDGVSYVLHALAAMGGGEQALAAARLEYREHSGRDLPAVAVDLGEVSQTLYEMDAASPLVKQQILRLCGLVVMEDGLVEDGELVLLRAVAEAIGAPIPPFVKKSE